MWHEDQRELRRLASSIGESTIDSLEHDVLMLLHDAYKLAMDRKVKEENDED